MKHTVTHNKKNPAQFTESLEFTDPYNAKGKTTLKCRWELNAGTLTRTSDSIADKLRAMQFDEDTVKAYETVYSEANMQSLIVMMFGESDKERGKSSGNT